MVIAEDSEHLDKMKTYFIYMYKSHNYFDASVSISIKNTHRKQLNHSIRSQRNLHVELLTSWVIILSNRFKTEIL